MLRKFAGRMVSALALVGLMAWVVTAQPPGPSAEKKTNVEKPADLPSTDSSPTLVAQPAVGVGSQDKAEFPRTPTLSASPFGHVSVGAGEQGQPAFFRDFQQHAMNGDLSAQEVELARKCEDLVRQLARSEGDSRQQIKERLTEALAKQFDLRQKRHESQIAALEAQVKKLRTLVQKRQDNRRDIISKRLEQLVQESEGLGW
jgi:hypothetical protein